MIINALSRYYDCLKALPESPLLPKGYSKEKISHVIVLNESGDMVNILPHVKTVVEKGKTKEAPKEELLPQRVSTTTILANFLEHRGEYIFGLSVDKTTGEYSAVDPEDKKKDKKTDSIKKKFEDYKEKTKILGETDSPLAKAIYRFSSNWHPENQLSNPLLAAIKKVFTMSKFTFCLESDINALACCDPKILEKWENLFSAQKSDDEPGYCSVSGEYLPIARIHDNLKGVMGGMSMGTNLVCVKNASEESFGQQQGKVSSISTAVMKKYTAAFNLLMESPFNHKSFGDTTMVFWAESRTDPIEIARSYAIANEFVEETEDMSKTVKSCLDFIKKGEAYDESFLKVLETKFYVLALKPNGGRLTVKFFLVNSLGNFLQNIKRHQEDLRLYEQHKVPSIGRILYETVSPKSSDKDPNPSLVSGLFEAVLKGSVYPRNLLSTVVARIKTDQDDDKNKFIKINDARVGVIKACLVREKRIKNKGEVITMGLNESNTNAAYLCGRLFAVLEKLQKEALGELNAGIKSKYFSSACTTPAMVFPRLLMLAQSHIQKLEKSGYLENQISGIVANLGDSFPKILDIEEQGKFILGYYQQNKFLYTKKEEK